MRLSGVVLMSLIGLSFAKAGVAREAERDQGAPAATSRSGSNQARLMLQTFAECVVATPRFRQPLKAFVSSPYDDPASRNFVQNLSRESRCLRGHSMTGFGDMAGGTLAFPQFLIRGMLFRALYLRQGMSKRLRDEPVDFAAYITDKSAPSSIEYRILMDFAGCVARTDIVGARNYVLARPDSPAEMVALAALQPSLGPCFPAGSQIKLAKPLLTSILAEALYREVGTGEGG